MKVNTQNIAITKGEAFSAVLEYKEDNRRVYTDYTDFHFKAQIRANRTLTGLLQGTLLVESVGLGQVRISLTDVQTGVINAGNYVWDLLASSDGIVDPEPMYSGTVTVSNPPPVVVPTYATQWENDSPTTTMTPVAGLYTTDKLVTLTVNDATAKVYYTLNGATPTVNSTLYSAPFTVTGTTTVKFFAVDTAGNAEAVQTVQIDIDKVAPVTTCNKTDNSTFATSSSVTLAADEPAITYYTLNGTTPTPGSSVYSTPLIFTEGTHTFKFFSVDTAGNAEAVQTLHFTVTA